MFCCFYSEKKNVAFKKMKPPSPSSSHLGHIGEVLHGNTNENEAEINSNTFLKLTTLTLSSQMNVLVAMVTHIERQHCDTENWT